MAESEEVLDDIVGDGADFSDTDFEQVLEGMVRTEDDEVDELCRMCSVAWEDELPGLQLVYGTDLETLNERNSMFKIQIISGAEGADQLWLSFVIPGDYPNVSPMFGIEPGQKYLTGQQADWLYRTLHHEAQGMLHNPMIYALCSVAVEYAQKAESPTELCEYIESLGLTPDKVALGLVDGEDPVYDDGTLRPDAKLEAFEKLAKKEAKNVPTADKFLPPITEIVKMMPRDTQVLHVENVVRPDIALRFQHQQNYYYRKYYEKYKNHHGVRARLAQTWKAVLGFHGTHSFAISSIVHNGLKVPEGAKDVRVGSVFGRGIYLAPEAETSCCFASGGKLLVCAALLGKKYIADWNDVDKLIGKGCKEGYDSHHVPEYPCYVLFKAAQVLPCYVIHFRNLNDLEMLVKNPTTANASLPPPPPKVVAGMSKEEKKALMQAHRQDLTQRARAKHFPFGFGPAGLKFEVLEMADVDEDEYEDVPYGEDGYSNEFGAAKELQRDKFVGNLGDLWTNWNPSGRITADQQQEAAAYTAMTNQLNLQNQTTTTTTTTQ